MQNPNELLIEIDKLIQNWQYFCSLQPSSTVVPVLKSDAYGHGASELALALQGVGANYLAVFSFPEALALRNAGVTVTLWLLQGLLPGELPYAYNLNLVSACGSFEQAEAMVAFAKEKRCRFKIHLKLDTGMSRLGFSTDEISKILHYIQKNPELDLCGCFSHLAISQDAEHPLTIQQVEDFRNVLPMLPETCKEISLSATNAMLNKVATELPFARLGIGLYGYSDTNIVTNSMQAVMTLKSKVVAVKKITKGKTVSYNALYEFDKDGVLAVIPLGYADGYPRILGNKADVLIRGKRLPIRGRVCMNMLMADASELENLQAGEEVVLLGKQKNEKIGADELAEKAGTNTHEILCNIGKIKQRKFV